MHSSAARSFRDTTRAAGTRWSYLGRETPRSAVGARLHAALETGALQITERPVADPEDVVAFLHDVGVARVADVDYLGDVHPTQFWQGYSPGNGCDSPFGDICEDETDPFSALRGRDDHLDGRCGGCASQAVCRGGSRLRALPVHDDIDAPDAVLPHRRGDDVAVV